MTSHYKLTAISFKTSEEAYSFIADNADNWVYLPYEGIQQSHAIFTAWDEDWSLKCYTVVYAKKVKVPKKAKAPQAPKNFSSYEDNLKVQEDRLAPMSAGNRDYDSTVKTVEYLKGKIEKLTALKDGKFLKTLQRLIKASKKTELWFDVYSDRLNFLIGVNTAYKTYLDACGLNTWTDRGGISLDIEAAHTLGLPTTPGTYVIPADARKKIFKK